MYTRQSKFNDETENIAQTRIHILYILVLYARESLQNPSKISFLVCNTNVYQIFKLRTERYIFILPGSKFIGIVHFLLGSTVTSCVNEDE